MEQMKKNLEEALEQIDFFTNERDVFKDSYEYAKAYISKLMDKIDDLKLKELSEKNSYDDFET